MRNVEQHTPDPLSQGESLLSKANEELRLLEDSIGLSPDRETLAFMKKQCVKTDSVYLGAAMELFELHFGHTGVSADQLFVPKDQTGDALYENHLLLYTSGVEEGCPCLHIYQFWYDESRGSIAGKFHVKFMSQGEGYISSRELERSLQGKGLMCDWECMFEKILNNNKIDTVRNASSGKKGRRGNTTWPFYGFRATQVDLLGLRMWLSQEDFVNLFLRHLQTKRIEKEISGFNDRPLDTELFYRISDVAQTRLVSKIKTREEIGKEWIKEHVSEFYGEKYIGRNPENLNFEDTIVFVESMRDRGDKQYLIDEFYPDFRDQKNAVATLKRHNRDDLAQKYYL